ncbi:MAG TPA: hypothetical protein VGD67_29105 [Pseudonocardiaceae bacterium]
MGEEGRPAVVGLSGADRAVLYGGGPVVGLGLGWALPHVAQWLEGMPGLPFRGLLRLAANWDGRWSTLTFLALGALAGLALAGYADWENLRVTVTADEVTLAAKGRSDGLARAAVGGAFVDGKRLVVLGTDGRELARRAHDSKPAELAAAFRAHGYRWHDADPYAEEFRRWVPDSPDVPPGPAALLRARATALEHKQQDEAEDLRRELSKLGWVVRDEQTRQYVRPVPGA